ncbi:hypothetical protein F0L46_22760 [Salinarimonas soli]|uniref:O-antigen ligase domain-containing protein n=1 Tax=Salinarimonas soli TaxID=1638099 RepID=A0A5B2V725_9HYPH|nr:hypothetical protein F0L46_22760 [Salinarimonas soli]
MIGLNYATPGGSIFEKIHPGTYCAIAGTALLTLSSGGRAILSSLIRNAGMLIYFILFTLFLLYVAIFCETPISPIVDTFLLPAFIIILSGASTRADLSGLSATIHIYMAANTALAIFELVSGWRILPSIYFRPDLGITVGLYDWRPSALSGHPLTGAALTGVYLLACLVTKQLTSPFFRIFTIGWSSVGLVAFGGRAALVFCAAVTMIYLAGNLIKIVSGFRVASHIYPVIIIVPVSIVLFGSLVAVGGLADQFLDRWDQDHGSAFTRYIALQIIQDQPFGNLVFGLPSEYIAELSVRYKTPYGIESFFLNFILLYGLIGFAVFMPALFLISQSAVRMTQPAGWLIILFIFANAAVSVSLSGKTTLFAASLVVILAVLGHGEHRVRRVNSPVGKGMPKQLGNPW